MFDIFQDFKNIILIFFLFLKIIFFFNPLSPGIPGDKSNPSSLDEDMYLLCLHVFHQQFQFSLPGIPGGENNPLVPC